MSEFNKYGLRQVGDRIRLPSMSVSVTEKQRDDGSTLRWAQLSKKNNKTGNWENFTVFPDDLVALEKFLPDVISLTSGGEVNELER